MKKQFSEFSQIGIGILLASLGLKMFLLPNGFLDGGVTGIAILLSELYNLNISIILVAVSFPFLIMSWFTLSRRITIKSIFAILLLAIMVHFENFTSVTDDKLLISIFGGLLLGAGIGLSIKNGAVLDGSEILGIFKSDIIEKELIEVIKTGTTLYRGSKGFGKRGARNESDIIHTVINRIDIRRTYNLIDGIDKNSFIIEFDVNNIKGGIIKEYWNKENMKGLLPSWE